MKRIALAASVVAGIACLVAVGLFRDRERREGEARRAFAERNRAVAVILAAHLAGEFQRTGRYPARLDGMGGNKGELKSVGSVVDGYHASADGRSCTFSVSGLVDGSWWEGGGEGYDGEGDQKGEVNYQPVAFAWSPAHAHQITDCGY